MAGEVEFQAYTRPAICGQAIEYLWNDNIDAECIAHDNVKSLAPEIGYGVFEDVELRPDFMPYIDNEVFTDTKYFPLYCGVYYQRGLVDSFGFQKHFEERIGSRPAYIVTNFNMNTYGHFLFEVLPKILFIKHMYDSGERFPILMPISTQWARVVVHCLAPRVEMIVYDDTKESIVNPRVIMPTLQISPEYDIHPMTVNLITTAALEAKLLLHLRNKDWPKKLFITRRNVNSFRKLVNESDLINIAEEFGYVAIAPEQLSFDQQVSLFHGATHVIGEFSSALHNTMFSLPGTKVICLTRRARLQAAISRAFRQPIGYIFTKDGQEPRHVHSLEPIQEFYIDPIEFRDRIAACESQ